MGENSCIWIPKEVLDEGHYQIYSLANLYNKVSLYRWWQITGFFGIERNVRNINYLEAVESLAKIKKKDELMKLGEGLHILTHMKQYRIIFQAEYEDLPPAKGYINFDEFYNRMISLAFEKRQAGIWIGKCRKCGARSEVRTVTHLKPGYHTKTSETLCIDCERSVKFNMCNSLHFKGYSHAKKGIAQLNTRVRRI